MEKMTHISKEQNDNEREPVELGEWYVYGSESHGRFAVRKPETPIIYDNNYMIPASPQPLYTRNVLFKEYEAKDHLGNVVATYSDLKLANYTSSQDPQQPFSLDLLTASAYYPFGSLQPNRHWVANPGGYRHGFNGMEKDDEVKGMGNSYDYGARFYDSRLGRFLSLDPLINEFPEQSPYLYAYNNPINFIDYEGKKGYKLGGRTGNSRNQLVGHMNPKFNNYRSAQKTITNFSSAIPKIKVPTSPLIFVGRSDNGSPQRTSQETSMEEFIFTLLVFENDIDFMGKLISLSLSVQKVNTIETINGINFFKDEFYIFSGNDIYELNRLEAEYDHKVQTKTEEKLKGYSEKARNLWHRIIEAEVKVELGPSPKEKIFMQFEKKLKDNEIIEGSSVNVKVPYIYQNIDD